MAQKSPADWAYGPIILHSQSFEELLDAEHQIAVRMRTRMIQHVSQLNVTLRALPKRPDRPAQRIGFRLARDQEPDWSSRNT